LKLTFMGAAQTVTGSMHLIETQGARILPRWRGTEYQLDCGLYQGRRQESFDRNRNLPFDPHGTDVTILSHAHIDHSGNVPNLVSSMGFLQRQEDPFGFYRLRYTRSVEESKALNKLEEPCIIISASGMCEAGRIQLLAYIQKVLTAGSLKRVFLVHGDLAACQALAMGIHDLGTFEGEVLIPERMQEVEL